MSRARTLLLSLLAMFVVIGVMSTTATAAANQWLVNGVEASGQEVTSSGGEFILSSTGKEVKCKKVTDKGSVEANGKDETSEIKFTGCAANESGTECSIKSAGPPAKAGEIIVNNTTTELTERFSTEKQATVLADEFKGKAAKENEFVTLEIGKKETSSGNIMTEKCANLPETTKVTGQVAAQVNNTTEALEFPSKELKGNTLKAFGTAAKLTGSVKQKLVAGGVLEAAKSKGPVWLINGAKLAAGKTAKVTSEKGPIFFFFFPKGKAKVLGECKKEKYKGTLSGGIPGTDTNTVEFSECAVAEPAGCKVTEPIKIGTITRLVYLWRKANGEKWKVTSQAEYKARKLEGAQTQLGDLNEPERGKTVVTVEITGCVEEKENGKHLVTGFFTGIVNNAAESLEFTKETSNLFYEEGEAIFEDTIKLELEGGGTVGAAEE
jgi:hypothetical protein